MATNSIAVYTIPYNIFGKWEFSTPTFPNTRTKLELAHDDVVINNNLDVNFINAQDMDLDINCVDHAINLGSRTNEINIGNKLNPNGCDIYFYGRVHHIVNTANDGFFEEVNGFLNQTGI